MTSNTLHWRGPLTISKRAELDPASTTLEVEFMDITVYYQNQILIEALEGFLKNFGGFRA